MAMNFMPIYLAFMAITGLAFVSFLISPVIALKKGYAPYYWMFACGPVGLMIVSCLRSTSKAKTPEELERMQSRANTIGAVLTGFAFLLALSAVGFLILGIG
jgi:hypothetical protein